MIGFGSITAARGRGRNFIYGAMKRALQSYFESLRLAARGTPVKIQFWVLGFLDSDAMKSEQTPLPKANPAHLADKVVGRLDRDTGVTYFPCWWRPLTLALRLMHLRVGGTTRQRIWTPPPVMSQALWLRTHNISQALWFLISALNQESAICCKLSWLLISRFK